MMRHKNITVAIIAAAILIAAAAMVTGRFVKASNESRDYDLASPALYVSRPEEGITGIIRDWRDTARLGPPFAQAVASLPDALVSVCRPSESHPVLITYYRDGSLAFWAAARNSSIQRLVASLAHDLSDGYSPVEERRPDGTHLYHLPRPTIALRISITTTRSSVTVTAANSSPRLPTTVCWPAP